MAKLLLAGILFVLLTLTACSDQAPTPVVTTVPAPQPEATQAGETATKKTEVAPPEPIVILTIAPAPTAIMVVLPTREPEPTATERATSAMTATQVPASTQTPTVTLPPAATAIPTAVPTPNPTATPTLTPTQPASTWRGLTVAPEDRCSPYDRDDYPYPPSVEPRIVDALGGIYGPYTGTWFESIRETDIEHIVARSEAHDSGLCESSAATRSEFASDLLNLTLASPSVNRHQKSDNDAAEWLRDLNQCWYVDRTVQVRREYGLTIDRAEAEAIDRVLATCESTDMVVLAYGGSTTAEATATPTPTAAPGATPNNEVDAPAMWNDNGNGRITCAEAQVHGIAPVRRGHPAYQYMRDADGDGVVCE